MQLGAWHWLLLRTESFRLGCRLGAYVQITVNVCQLYQKVVKLRTSPSPFSHIQFSDLVTRLKLMWQAAVRPVFTAFNKTKWRQVAVNYLE